ncbi:unnamed protein product [Amaranthus hypochondriacus]
MVLIDKQKAFGSDCQPNWCLQLNGYERINEVIISSESVVNGIGFVIADVFGRTITKWFGSRSGCIWKIKLKSNEYITNLSGTQGVYSYTGYTVISSLSIHTNLCPSGYGPYGVASSCNNIYRFSTNARRGTIVGFHGRYSQHLESIGICIRRAIN